MNRLSIALVLSISLLSLSTSPSTAQAPAGGANAVACKKFVTDFYTWYTKGKPQPTERTVLEKKKSILSPQLHAALKEDFDASVKSKDEIVGLDFDPFLNAQDIAESYEVGEVKQKGSTYLVDVFGVWNKKRNKTPDVVAEAQNLNGNWVFTNMHYGKSDIPENENLLSILKVLKKDRAHN